MVTRKGVLFCLLLMIPISFLATPLFGDDFEDGDALCIPMASFELEAPDGITAKRSTVNFPHALHFDYSCKKCHHKWEARTEIDSCMTSGCHDALESGGSKDNIAYYKNAYHGQCIGCHKELKAERAKLVAAASVKEDTPRGGPTSCVACHPKDE